MAEHDEHDERDEDKKVFIDIETATETVTRQEDVDRIRREAGVEEGEPPPRGVPEGVGDEAYEEGSGPDDRRIDLALEHRDGPQPG